MVNGVVAARFFLAMAYSAKTSVLVFFEICDLILSTYWCLQMVLATVACVMVGLVAPGV